MLTIEKTVLPSPDQWEIIIEGMRNPMNSWDKMDSDFEYTVFGDARFRVGDKDYALMTKLAKGGAVHAKYRRMIPVWVTINAPFYFYKEMDTYKVGTVCNSCSTMHKIHSKEFTLDDFSHDHLIDETDEEYQYESPEGVLEFNIGVLNHFRRRFLDTNEKKYWWQMIQLLPSSYNQKRTYMFNYEVLCNIYHSRKNHKLDEWHTFCAWIESLPYADLIIGGDDNG